MKKKRVLIVKRVELLAPAGTIEAVYAAVFHGADAIYCGGKQFGARAYANNFSHDEMREVIRFCHLRGVKVYITMNTLLYENEIDLAMEEVAFYYENDVDALIVQDLGLLDRLCKEYPDFEVHASTQMHIHNPSQIKLLKKLGVKRVVIARETPIELLEQCTKLGMDIEVFTYGALCVSYSGQCLISKFTQNRSGNRGMCAQCCRMKYKLFNENQEISTEGDYLLSPKDLNVIEKLPLLIEAGVTSLKIEGRMKRAEYVGLAVQSFREAIDNYYAQKTYTLENKRLDQLKLMFNRGFSEGFLFSNGATLMNSFRPNHMGISIGRVVFARNGIIEIEIDGEVNQGDGLRIISKYEDIGLVTTKLEVQKKLVSTAKKGDRITFYHSGKVFVNDAVVKTTDILLNKRIQQDEKNYKRIQVDINYEVKLNQALKLSMRDNDGNVVEATSEQVCMTAKNSPITKLKLEEMLGKLGDSVYQVGEFSGVFEPFFLPVKEINELRRQAVELLNEERAIRHKNRKGKEGYRSLQMKLISQDICAVEITSEKQYYQLMKQPKSIQIFSNRKKLITQFKVNPIHSVVNEVGYYPQGDFIVAHELGSLQHKEPSTVIIASSHFNVCNSYALQFLYEHAVDIVMFSHEMTKEQRNQTLQAFQKRNHQEAIIIDYAYGQRDLMILKHCPVNSALLDGKKVDCDLCKKQDYWLQNNQKERFYLKGDDLCIQHVVEERVYQLDNKPLQSAWYQYFDGIVK
ncbi:MAG: peptidase U32 family protein [Anaerorhabdus sp.]